MGKTVVVYAGEQPPGAWQASMFVAGPMPRDPDAPSWRPEALHLIVDGWTGPGTLVVFVPEARDRHRPQAGYISQDWEERWMAVADVIMFWVPRRMPDLPGLNTNIEYGRTETSGRVVLGLPPDAVSVHYLRRGAEAHGVPVRDTLDATIGAVLAIIGDGAQRDGADRDVPLLIWRTDTFQAWRRRKPAELTSARVLWAWTPPPTFELAAWAMKVEVTPLDYDDAHTMLVTAIGDGTTTHIAIADHDRYTTEPQAARSAKSRRTPARATSVAGDPAGWSPPLMMPPASRADTPMALNERPGEDAGAAGRRGARRSPLPASRTDSC
ncbi:hypothetical protein QTQ03_28630 [Micromonospora sp. WMMA1363]|uniref:hypothetical protein n=1 Tax=Micromonospora sp. WMMA1363 TaxID=3053985 RepID=UPI00259D1413|nr:hypothetical protein [Micromonospora sp. WMMA1363]MDM4723280.1 hypothetical protein [Micromonospora sp. WMMA1363]MDM4723374.1 hypothetical protein [Micromonospora sp. WMMA1363]